MNPTKEAMNNCYTFNISINQLVRKEDMNEPRAAHGLQPITQKIFAFGGCNMGKNIKTAEVYDYMQNS